MKIGFHFSTEPTHVVCIPTIIAASGECECCGEPGGVMLSVAFLIWEIGISFSPPPHKGH